jgi:N-acyl-D-amino-acid deacylase
VETFPATGVAAPGMGSFDRIVPDLMKKWGIPGGAVAVVKDGRLVLARGYGYADPAKQSVQPDALFRIASVSKPLTAVAILKLWEEGKLDLDSKAFVLRGDLLPPPGATVDPRVYDVTVRQLLHHAGGWDREVSFDPMFRSATAAQAVGVPAPASAETVMRYMLGQPLDFTPGSRYAYSNFGYAVLGRVIEKVTGESYEQYVKRAILTPAGATRMRLGRSLLAERHPEEVQYFDLGSASSVFPGGGTVSFPYGGFYLEAMDSHGGWVASTIDLLRFLTAVDGLSTRPDVLGPAAIQLMVAPSPPPLWQGSAYHYGMGWLIRPAQGNWWHDGSLPGTTALLVRTGGGLAWAVLFNSRSMVPGSNWANFHNETDMAIWQAVGQVTDWPAHDLFTQYK